MEDLLQEIKMLPGVSGVVVYLGQPDLTFSDVPDNYQEETLKQMQVAMERIFKMNSSCNLSVNSLEILFDESMVLAKRVGSSATLVAICEPDANFALVNMTSNMLIGELARAVEEIRKNPDAAKKAKPKAQAKPQAKPKAAPAPAGTASYAEAKEVEPLKSAIPVFQESLAKAIGPIAEMIVKETLEKWLAAGPCTTERFSDLINAFCHEIGDHDLEKEFRNDVSLLR
jgi:hypothetical protein